MTSAKTVMESLKAKASEKTRVTYLRHGGPADATLGVSVADMKLLAKPLKGQQDLALGLYETSVFEAQYLAGMFASGKLMTPKQLNAWADGASGQMISEHTVAWVAVEHPEAASLAKKWMASKKDGVASSGWCTYSGLLATQPDEALDLEDIKALLLKIPKDIAKAKNRERYTMNGFVISVGTYVKPLLKEAQAAAKVIGNVSVDVGDTACEVPVALERIAKVGAKVGLKKKTIRC